MNYSAVVASPAAFGAATALPHEGVLWLVARLMLDSAGGLFGPVRDRIRRTGWRGARVRRTGSAASSAWPKGRAGRLRHPVVLMHNQPAGNPATVAALPVIIRFFRSHGYRFVRL